MIGGVEVFRELEEFRMLIFGLLMVFIMVWRPRGLISTRTPSIALFKKKAIGADSVGEGPADGKLSENPILKVEHLTMRFGGLVAVNDLSIDVGRGDITALIGPNGAGKTDRVQLPHWLLQADRGPHRHTHHDGAEFLLERMPDFQISRHAKVARTFQNIRLFGGMTVLENLMVAQHNPLMAASSFSIAGILSLPSYRDAEKKAIDKARYWLEHVDLTDRADDPASDLPYGAQRRLEIARAMSTGPELLCLEEPAAGLNPRESSELNKLLRYIRETHGTSILLIEHDMSVVMEISDHVVVLDYGVKISDGDPDFVKKRPCGHIYTRELLLVIVATG